MHHYRKTVHQYRRRQKTQSCPFCQESTISNAVFENDLVYIVPNLTQYDLWELHDVQDHLLIIPKRHIETLENLTDDERLAIMSQAAIYEIKGYSVYTRSVSFANRSVKHQHTHLIKVTNKSPKLAIFLQTPYFLFKK